VTSLPLEDYALLGDLRTAALVAKNGSIDWLCVPRFDSSSCFGALLGDESNGRWIISPLSPVKSVRRAYRPRTMILETEMTTEEGVVSLVDVMLPRDGFTELVRLVVGREGRVPMRTQIIVRGEYGSVTPWVRRMDGRLTAVMGPDALCFDSPVDLRGEAMTTVGEWSVGRGDQTPFVMLWHPSHVPLPAPIDAVAEIARADAWWRAWASGLSARDGADEAVQRSLLTLKTMIYSPTGGIVASPTTSLPEKLGGSRNWDYRYCWLRDATFSLLALVRAGYTTEAVAWRDWLLRAAAGDPSKLQIMYGPAGERRLAEYEVPWLAGYAGSVPVRVGNAASAQFQLDVYGEVIDALYQAARAGVPHNDAAWGMQRSIVGFLETAWQKEDDGIWEVRGQRRHFTHSKVMAWVALDRAVRSIEEHGAEGPVDRWRQLRADVHREVCERGYCSKKGSFVQSYGGDVVDASLLMIPLVGFLPADDPRVRGTIAAVQRELYQGGFVYRYPTREDIDGLPPGEGAFLMCTFWLADCLALIGHHEEAQAIYDRLLRLRNDVGLLSEQYDPSRRRLVGNFPQAFSHVALVNTAAHLRDGTQAHVRSR
jgi:GH15 family glucan-1,4-alpha-glucosidase